MQIRGWIFTASAGIILLGLLAWRIGERSPSSEHTNLKTPRAPASASRHVTGGDMAGRVPPDYNRKLANADGPLPPVNAPLLDIYDDLYARAMSGDHPAQCRLSFELNRCRTLKRIEATAAIAAKTAAAVKEGVNKAAEAKINRAAYWAQRSKEAANACEGFPVEKTDKAFMFQLAAAEAGHGPSMIRVITFPYGLDFEQPLKTAKEWAEWQAAAPKILERGVAEGYPQAYQQAALAYTTPYWNCRLYPQDYVKSLAFWKALDNVAAPSFKRPTELSMKLTIENGHLSDADVRAADDLAAVLTSKAKVPPGGVDFQDGMFRDDDGSFCGQ